MRRVNNSSATDLMMLDSNDLRRRPFRERKKIIIGGVAGWLAEQFMKSEMGLVMNIVLGIIGAAVASAILSFLGVHLGGWLGYLIAGFIGAVLLIWVYRAVGDAG